MVLVIIHVMETDHWSHSVFLLPMFIMAPLLKDGLLAGRCGEACLVQLLWQYKSGKNTDDRHTVHHICGCSF